MPFAWKSSLRWVVLLAIFSASASVELVRHSALHDLANADFWMHLRIGTDILNSHSWPRTGWGSQLGAHSWVDATWLFDVSLALLYRVLDLRVLLLGGLAARIAVAGAIFLLAGGARGRFWTAVGLSLIGQIILSNIQPLPVVCSMLCVAVELRILQEYRSTRVVRWPNALPLLFAIWANLDFNFVFGIATLLLFAASEQFRPRPERYPRTNIAVAGALLATCVTPYGWGAYTVFFHDVTSAAGQYLPGHGAMRFRTPQDYLLMLLAMAAFLLLGRRQSRDWFQIAILLGSTLAAFYAERYAWLLVLSSVTIIGSSAEAETSILARVWKPAVAIIAATVIFSAVAVSRYDKFQVMAEIAQTYPVHAADFLRGRSAPPVFNSMEFGGFLAWDLPRVQVAIDGRAGLYDDDDLIHYAKVVNAEEHFSTLPSLVQVDYLVLSRKSLIAAALASVPEYETAYSDDLAVVLHRVSAQP